MKTTRSKKKRFDLGFFTPPLFLIAYTITFLFAQISYSQWYLEAGLNSSNFSNYSNTAGEHILGNGFSRPLEMSAATGHRFGFFDDRLELGLGVAFDQHQINAVDNRLNPITYNYTFSFASIEAAALLKLVQFGKQHDKGPSLWAQVGLSRGWPVYGVQRIISDNINRYIDLLDQEGFSKPSNFYHYGASFRVPATDFSDLYFSITQNRSYTIRETNLEDGGTERFGFDFLSFNVGVVYGFKQRKLLKQQDQGVERSEFLALQDRITALEKERLKQKNTIEALYAQLGQLTTEIQSAAPVETLTWSPELIILFDLNDSKLSNQAQVKIEAFVAAYLKTNSTQKIKIHGYADEFTGNPNINQYLSDRRAQAVADLMTSMGVPQSQLESEGKGQTSIHNKTNPDLNRRVEIFFE